MSENDRQHNRRHNREMASEGIADHRRARDIALLIAGIGIGSAVSLLLSPATGEEVRHTIRRGYRKTVKNISRRAEDLRDRADHLLEHAHDLREHGSRLLHFARGKNVRRAA